MEPLLIFLTNLFPGKAAWLWIACSLARTRGPAPATSW